jgi:hypothetical protein
VIWIKLAQDKILWWAFVNSDLNILKFLYQLGDDQELLLRSENVYYEDLVFSKAYIHSFSCRSQLET